MTTLKIRGNWNEIQGILKQKYAQLTADDLLFEEGREEELLGRLQARTGEARETFYSLISGICPQWPIP